MYVILISFIVFCLLVSFRTQLAKIFNLKINHRLELFIIVFLIILYLITFISSYIKYDKQLYYYGRGCAFGQSDLPYHMKPKFETDYPSIFVLLDDDDFELVGRGFRYRRTDFVIKDFLEYGYNDSSIIVKVTDSLNNIKYLSSYETVNKSTHGNTEISFEDLSEPKFQQVKSTYTWMDLDEEKERTLMDHRALSFIGIVLALILLIRLLIKNRSILMKQKPL